MAPTDDQNTKRYRVNSSHNVTRNFTLPATLANLLALKLGVNPFASPAKARTAVVQWADARIEDRTRREYGRFDIPIRRLSTWLISHALREVTDAKLYQELQSLQDEHARKRLFGRSPNT